MKKTTEIDAGDISLEAISEEVVAVLSEAGRPMTLREIAAASELFAGAASVAGPLAEMVEDGSVERRVVDGRPTFQLARSCPPPNTTKHTHADAALAALRERGPLSRQEIAEAAGCAPKRASDVLTQLARRGLVARIDGGRWAAAEPDPGTAEPKPAAQTEPTKARHEPSPAGQGSHPSPGAVPIIALRSDGVVEIRRAGAALVEISPAEMAELQSFVDHLRSARR